MTAAAVVFDWFATLAAPHADDLWERLPELIEQALGVPDAATLAEWHARAGITASELTFVGDNWHDDVTGARPAGFTPVHMSRSGTCPVADHDAVTCGIDLRDLDALRH